VLLAHRSGKSTILRMIAGLESNIRRDT